MADLATLAQNVVGGVDKPRFLILGPELWTNRSFEENLNGVSGSATLTRLLDVNTPFGDYVLKIEDASGAAAQSANFAVETGNPVAGKKFIILGYVRSNSEDDPQDFYSEVDHNWPGTTSQEYVAQTDWQQLLVHEIEVAGGEAGTVFNFKLYPSLKSAGAGGTGAIKVDMIRVREILKSFELPEVPRGALKPEFVPEAQAEVRMTNGDEKVYNQQMRYVYESEYEQLQVQDEVNRRELIRTPHEILVFPHRDSAQAFFMRWARDSYADAHAFGIASAGNAGNVSLRGTELIPRMASTALDGYIYIEDVIYV